MIKYIALGWLLLASFTTNAGELADCGWMCPETCIDKSWICDGYEQCDDNSKEEKIREKVATCFLIQDVQAMEG